MTPILLIQILEKNYGNNNQERGNAMLTPLLVIGLGGSGGKTIRSMKQALNRKLESVRYEGGLPDAWQFLQIDTTYDGVAFPAPMLPKDEFHCVVPNGSGFYDVLASITNRGTVSDQHKMLSGWGVRNSAISIQAGAGQIRAIGRQVGVADSAKTLDAIKSAISKMQAETAMADLRSVAKALKGEVPQNATPQAFIISSIAGGSGAGMFMDVAELLKRATAQNWGTEYGVLEMNVGVVDSLESAIDHIATFGTQHTEAIVTEDKESARRFIAMSDCAAVMVNASTRFTDGEQMGFGAEIGISNQKLHARGPMGLEAMTTTTWIVTGTGQIRS